MIKVTSTKDVKLDGVKLLVHGPAGIGKTVLCSTAPSPLIISAEAGLLSLQTIHVPVINVTSTEEVNEAYRFVSESAEARQYKTICLDSISEIAEAMLILYKEGVKDPRQAYGQMNDDIATMIRKFRDLKGKNVYFSAKQLKEEMSDGITRLVASMPGKTVLHAMPFYFDLVCAMRIGMLSDGRTYRYLHTYQDLMYDAKDRSGLLLPQEKPNLTYLFDKIIKGGK